MELEFSMFHSCFQLLFDGPVSVSRNQLNELRALRQITASSTTLTTVKFYYFQV